MLKSDEKIPKYKIEVQVELDNGTQLLGSMFVNQMQRTSDLLNDAREFLPFQTSDGTIVYLRKATIAKVVELKRDIELDATTDPYEVSGAVSKHQ